MSATFTQSGNTGTIKLDGDLTLQTAEELKQVLKQALAAADEITIALGNLQDVDLSALQLLCSAHRSAVRQKKRITLTGKAPRAFTEAAEAAGYLKLTGCKLDIEKGCLWMMVAGAKA